MNYLNFKKAILQGAIMYGYGMYAYPNGAVYSANLGMTLKTPTIIGMAGVGSGLIGDNLQNMLQPSAQRGGKYKTSNGALMSALLNGATYLGMLAIVDSRLLSGGGTSGLVRLMAEGIAGDMVADYVSPMVL